MSSSHSEYQDSRLKRKSSPSDSYHHQTYKRQNEGHDISSAVASHYNARPSQSREIRKESKIIKLRSFNNWIKSVLINLHTRRGFNVLDMGCGKGGDLMKWLKTGIADFTGADIASVSIDQAQQRYDTIRGNKFSARFYALDCYNNPLTPLLPPNHTFDLVSMQFCMHYAFETEIKVRQMLRNVTDRLKPGGTFVGTIPNAYWIVKKLKSTSGNKFGNPIYSIAFEKETPPSQLFGREYIFHLEDAIDSCPEYLVHWPTFERIASEYGLRPLYHTPFHQFYQRYIEDPKFQELFYRMGVIDSDGMSLSREEWEAVGLYMAFAFRKE